jgi:hypothetical protein
MSLKNSNDTIGNRTRDISACSAVPQPTGPLPLALYKLPSELFYRAKNMGVQDGMTKVRLEKLYNENMYSVHVCVCV